MIELNNAYCSSYSHTSPFLVRSTWARTVLNKQENDRCLKSIDRNQWYRLSYSERLDEQYRERFDQFAEDEETTAFIQQCEEKSDNIPLQIIQNILTSFLTLFITRTSGMEIRKLKIKHSSSSSKWFAWSWSNVCLFQQAISKSN